MKRYLSYAPFELPSYPHSPAFRNYLTSHRNLIKKFRMRLLKNPSPNNISMLAAVLASIAPLAALMVFGVNWIWATTVYAVCVVTSYFIFHALLETFIYRKIKVIYKNIHQLKTRDFEIPADKDPITEVSEEVSAWANDRRNEIQTLKKQESFRREFLGNVSHELKTPIFNIQGYLHTLLDGALTDNAVNRKFLERAAKSTERLAELVQDLNTISRIESGQLEMIFADFDIHELAKEVFEALEMKAKERKVKLRFTEGSDHVLSVLGDRSRIKQVLTNLVTNAIRYGKEKGTVLIGFYDMDQNLLIEVSDDGEGIPAEHLPRLFERFYRVDKSRSREAGGSGLGLAIVKHIIEAHSQTIHVRSAVGEGTTFGFTLRKGK